ncbi:hypothetical protein SK128_006079 [Halocaridina rubra]|uniref:Uncharacterized protein n=1 Tax=Halocaridina rubra TaxID=373956 RepID=A0AAN8XTE6_HALRR
MAQEGNNTEVMARQWFQYMSGDEVLFDIFHYFSDDLQPYAPIPKDKEEDSDFLTLQQLTKEENMNHNENISALRDSERNRSLEKYRYSQNISPNSDISASVFLKGQNNVIRGLSLRLQSSMNRDSWKLVNNTSHTRKRRDDRGMMYLPIGGTKKVSCPTAADAAGVSITQMAFLSICLTVFSIIVNISNNINNNNNNNNLNSDNNLSNNNAQLSLNVNNAAQVNVMLPPPVPGRKKRSNLRDIWNEVEIKVASDNIDQLYQELLGNKETDDVQEPYSPGGTKYNTFYIVSDHAKMLRASN